MRQRSDDWLSLLPTVGAVIGTAVGAVIGTAVGAAVGFLICGGVGAVLCPRSDPYPSGIAAQEVCNSL